MRAKRPSFVALIQGFKWAVESTTIQIQHGISLCSFEGSVVARLYKELCEETGIDDYDPFNYQVYVQLEPTEDVPYVDFGTPDSLVDRFSNLLAILTAQPVGMCRVIWSIDGFQSADGTSLVYVAQGQTEFLEKEWSQVTTTLTQDIVVAWRNQQVAWERMKSRGRLATALTYFYYAWRAHYADQICLNLAIALEILFAPHSQSETSHQVSYNLARFCGQSTEDRERLYRFAKKFYGERSKVVHGGLPDDDMLIDAVIKAFPMVAGILKTILLDEKLAKTFDDDTLRKQMLNRFLFE